VSTPGRSEPVGVHSTTLAPGLEQRLQTLADSFLDQLQAGEAVDPQVLLAEHPEIAGLLAPRLALVEQLYRFARQPSWRSFPAPSSSEAAAARTLSYEPGDHEPASLQAGTGEVGDFQILEMVGKGAFSRVFLARQLSLDRLVALKVSSAGSQEARTLASLEHDHIIQVFSESIDRASGQRVLCMQYVAGTTLERVIRALAGRERRTWSGDTLREAIAVLSTGPALTGPAPRPGEQRLDGLDYSGAVCWLGACLAQALSYAHARGVLHRDIKPANILLNRDGRPFLADFNLARDSGRNSAADEPFGGTLDYMAPEHLDAFNPAAPAAREAVDARSDIYSLGVVLFELLAGQCPFPRASPGRPSDEDLAAMAAQRRSKVPSPRLIQPETPPVLDRVVRRCLAPRPEERYPSAAELVQALEGCRELFRIRKAMPRAGFVTRAAGSRPILTGYLMSIAPHLLGSLLSISYNVLRIGGSLPGEGEKALVLWLTTAYTGVVFLVTIALAFWVVGPLGRGLRRLRSPGDVPPAEVAALRRLALTLPSWGVILSCVGWLPGSVLVPVLLGLLLGQPLPLKIYLHFFLSFAVAGLMALPYNVYAMHFLVLRVMYPRLLAADPRLIRQTATAELPSERRRLACLPFLAGLIPLLSAAAFVAAGPEATSSTYAAFRLLVLVFLALGGVGFMAALLFSNRLHQTLTALTGREEPARHREGSTADPL
jgi:serine/threonine protein kinase